MSILKGIFEKRAIGPVSAFNPNAIPTNGQAAIWDGAGASLSSNQAMRHAAVYACVRVIADAVGSFPIDAYMGDRANHLGQSKRINPKPPILTQPSAYLSGVQWTHQVLMALLLQGNAYGLITASDRLGYPTQIDLLDPQQVSVRKAVDGDVDSASGRRIPASTKVFRVGSSLLTSNDVWHCPGPMMPGELAGLSPVKYASRVITAGLEQENFAIDFFANGIHPTAVATTEQPIDQEQAERIKLSIKRAVANRDLPVLGAGVTLAPWTITPSDSQLLDVQRYNEVMVCQIFGVPAEMINAATQGASITYANREQRAMDFLNNAINPWLIRLEDSFSSLFPRTTFVKFDTTTMLKSDLSTRYTAHRTGIEAGFLTVDEARQMEDLPAAPVKAEEDEASARDIAEAVQKIYLGVANGVLTADEARTIVNRLGADLVIPGPPELHPAPAGPTIEDTNYDNPA